MHLSRVRTRLPSVVSRTPARRSRPEQRSWDSPRALGHPLLEGAQVNVPGGRQAPCCSCPSRSCHACEQLLATRTLPHEVDTPHVHIDHVISYCMHRAMKALRINAWRQESLMIMIR